MAQGASVAPKAATVSARPHLTSAVGPTSLPAWPHGPQPRLDSIHSHHGILAMKALSADQAGRFFSYLARFNQARQHPITIGLLDGDTPWNDESLAAQEMAGQLRRCYFAAPSTLSLL